MTPSPSPQGTTAAPAFNPAMPHELKLSKDAEEWLKTVNPGFQNDEQIQQFWNAAPTQFSLTLMNDAEFRGAVKQIQDEHAWGRFFGYELVLLLLLYTVIPWRLSKAQSWIGKVWTQFWLAGVFWILSILLVPGLVWGDAYRTLLSHLLKAAFRHFFA